MSEKVFSLVFKEKVRLVRRMLLSQGRVMVRQGQKVRPESVIGSYWKTSGFKTYNLSRLMKVSPSKCKDILLKPVGSQIYQGNVLARTRKFLGLKTIEFISPVSGVIYSLSEETGLLTIQQNPKEVRLASGVSGEVTRVFPGKGVEIKTCVSGIRGVLSVGNDREGFLKMIANPDIAISPQVIDSSCQGKIIFGGALLSKEVIHKCLVLQVRGVVCGGIHWRDFEELTTRARGRAEDVGLSVVVTEGFGYQIMNQKIFDTLVSLKDRFAIILTEKGEILIPGSVRELENKTISEPGIIQSIEVGCWVRVMLLPRVDVFGKITKPSVGWQETPSGIKIQMCEVEIGKEKKLVPLRNVSVVDM